MNGRCATDPLDLAVDVCDRCYGEFCSNHLVKPKGRRHPLCSNCALEASGVRGTAKLELLGSRRTAKKRRADLKAASANGEQVFQFFDHEDADADPGQVFSNTSVDEGDGLVADDETDAGSDEVPPTPAMTKLEELRRETRQEPAADATPPAPVVLEADDATPPQPSTEQVDDSEARPVPPPPPPEFNLEPAAEADEVEPAKQPAIAEQVPDPEPRPAPQPELQPELQPEPVVVTEPDPEPQPAKAAPSVVEISPVAEQHPDPAEQPGSVDRAPGALPLPNRHSTVRPPERRATDNSGTPKPDRRRDLPPPTHRRPTAPMIGEVRNVAGRRADDAPPTPEPSPEPVVAAAALSAESPTALNAIEAFDAKRPAPRTSRSETEPPEKADAANTADSADEDLTSDRADVDESGNWIPPILRGFAPDAAEAKSELPQRRS